MKKISLRIVILSSLALTSFAFAADIKNCKSGGMNLTSYNYYASDFHYKDILKMASPIGRAGGERSKYAQIPLEFNSDRYLISLDEGGAETYLTQDSWSRDSAKDNKYVILYDGEGTFDFSLTKPQIVKSEPGRMEVILNPGPIFIVFKTINPKNPISNMRVIPLEDEKNPQASIFRPNYMQRWTKFPVLRFMDLLGTNGAKVTSWESRKLTSQWGAYGGMPIEDIISMANEGQFAPWITIPHMATDDYITNFATYAKEHLDPKLKIYVEYSNEVWNSGFQQSGYANQEGSKRGMKGYEFYAERSLNIFKIWENVFGGTDRIVRVVGTQFVNDWLSDVILSWKDLDKHTDALAVGSYFGGEYGSDEQLIEKTLALPTDKFLEELKNVGLPKNKNFIVKQKAVADKHHVALISYEGGQHLVGAGFNPKFGGFLPDNQALTNALIAAQRHPMMKDIYLQYYKNWEEAGGSLLVWFASTTAYSKWGSWGVSESSNQPVEQAPKLAAVLEILNNTQANQADCKFVKTTK